MPSQIFKDSNPSLASITMQYALTTTNTAPTEFKNNDGTGEKSLFTKFDTTTKTDITLTKNDAGNYVATLNASELLSLVTINSFKLDTYAKYTAFSTVLGSFGNIGVEISEKTA